MPKLPTKIACYDSGHGLSVCADIGESEVSTIEMIQNRFFKIKLPDHDCIGFKQWEEEFMLQKALINAMIDAYNEKMEREND